MLGLSGGNWSDKLHSGSDWPVCSRINLSLQTHVFGVFGAYEAFACALADLKVKELVAHVD